MPRRRTSSRRGSRRVAGGCATSTAPSGAAGSSCATTWPARRPASSRSPATSSACTRRTRPRSCSSARARLDPFAVADLEDALYERRTLLRMLAMRRTMFVVPLDLAAVMDAACTRALVPGERRKLVAMLTDGRRHRRRRGVDRAGRGRDARRAARGGEPLPASRLTKLVPDLALQLRMAVGKRYEGTVGVSTRMLFLLSTEGCIARGRPLGSWLSSQYRWVPMDDWIGALPDLPTEAARAELARRWLRSFGPGTVDDLAWWTKWTKRDVRAALGRRRRGRGDHGHRRRPAAPAWVLADDLDDTPAEAAAPDGVAAGGAAARARPDDHGVEAPRRGTSARTAARCSTATATPARRCGSAGGPSGPGASGPAARSSPACSRPSRAGHRRAHRGGGRAAHRVDGRRPGDPPLPDPARPRARRPRLMVRA